MLITRCPKPTGLCTMISMAELSERIVKILHEQRAS